MKIPKKFKLFGETITVEYVLDLIEKHERMGQAIYRENKIQLLDIDNDTYSTKPTVHIEQTFFHELIHFILTKMNLNDLSADEKFVDVFASLLHQAMTTMEY